MILRVVMAVAAVAGFGIVAAALVRPGDRLARLRPAASLAVGVAAAALVFDMQRGGFGASLGGAVLALAAGVLAVLIMSLFRSV